MALLFARLISFLTPKIWKRDLNSIPLQWLDGKLPMPDIAKILVDNIAARPEADMPHSTFIILEGGSQFIINRFYKAVDLNMKSLFCNNKSNCHIVNHEEAYDKIIYTGT